MGRRGASDMVGCASGGGLYLQLIHGFDKFPEGI